MRRDYALDFSPNHHHCRISSLPLSLREPYVAVVGPDPGRETANHSAPEANHSRRDHSCQNVIAVLNAVNLSRVVRARWGVRRRRFQLLIRAARVYAPLCCQQLRFLC